MSHDTSAKPAGRSGRASAPRGRNVLIQPKDRAAKLAQTQKLKMSRSAHAYVRGSTVSFYQWLESSPANVPAGPSVWICGDCHLGNLGPLADSRGHVAVQIRDLDQTVIGNPAHDVIRLALSLASAARGSDLPGVTTARLIEQMMAGYETAIAGEFDKDAEKALRPVSIRGLLARSVRRRWRHLAAERLDTVKPVVPLGRRFWPLTDEERAGLSDLFAREDVRAMVTRLQSRDDDDPVTMVDAAYWMKGCSSLGRVRYAAMLRVGDGDGSTSCLLDVKEAVVAAAPRAPDAAMPKDNAQRVVAGAKALSPNLGERMIAAHLLGKPVVIRELLPQDLKLEVGRMTEHKILPLAAYLAGIVGRAHGRQMSAETRTGWLKELTHARTSALDAPTWLWSSVVTLMSIHEGAYLEHCRRFALADARESR